jgi:anti-anti-sigma factor
MFEYDVKNADGNVTVTLKGRLDATSAPDLYTAMEKLKGTAISKILFDVKELEYIASAGLRVIIFTKQKLGQNAEVFMEGANDMVKSVLEMTGCENFVTLI